MATDGQGRVPDILLERYLAGDLSQEQRRRIEAERDTSEDVRQRLEKLEQERAAFLAVDSPEQFAHRLATRLSVEAEVTAPVRRRWWAWILAPSAAAAATLLVTVTVVKMREDAPSSSTSALEQSELVGEMPPVSERPVEAKRDARRAVQEATVELHEVEDADLSGREEAPKRPRQRFRVAKRRAGRATGAKDRAGGQTTAFFGSEAGALGVAGAGTGAATPEPASQPEPALQPDPAPPAGVAAVADSAATVAPRGDLDAPPPPAASPALVAESEAGPEPAATRESAAPVSRSAPPRKRKQAKPRAKPKRDAKKARLEDAAPFAPPEPAVGADVMRVFRKNASKLNQCVDESRKRGELPAGLRRIALELTIAATGKVAKVAVAPKDRVPKPLARCMRKVLGPVAFPRSNEAARTITIPLRL